MHIKDKKSLNFSIKNLIQFLSLYLVLWKKIKKKTPKKFYCHFYCDCQVFEEEPTEEVNEAVGGGTRKVSLAVMSITDKVDM